MVMAGVNMMDVDLYKAAKEGQVDILLENTDKLAQQLTQTKNTLLHIAALFGQTQCVTTILTNCSSILPYTNEKGETALHIAAKAGHFEIARALITQTLLRKTNEDGDTALHLALRSSHCDVELVKLLIEKDPGFTYPPNKADETPLYLAAERGLDDCVSQILKSSQPPSPHGPIGRTALHAAAISNSQGSIMELLKWKQGHLSKKVDKYGWMPIHYAARLGHLQSVRQLIEFDASLAYVHADDGEDDNNNNNNNNNTTSVLHIAAIHGHVEIMEHIISQCPDCCEMVNSRGENILHVAVKNQKFEVIKFILKDTFLENLVTQKDQDGNTPLHMLAVSRDSDSFPSNLLTHPRAHTALITFNNENRTPLDVHLHKAIQDANLETDSNSMRSIQRVGAEGRRNVVSNDKLFEIAMKKRCSMEFVEKSMKKSKVKKSKVDSGRNMVVAALIATVSFAAAFTLPGGYDGNEGSGQGKAVLAKSKAFKAFLITDSVATMCSSFAVFIYFSESVKMKPIMDWSDMAPKLVSMSRIAMLLAFVTGIYATLTHALALAIFICIIGCVAIYIPMARITSSTYSLFLD